MEVHYKEYTYNINGALADRQQITEEQKNTLAYLYYQLQSLLTEAKGMNPKTDSTKLKAIAEQVKTVEFQLQSNWNFPQDEKFHSYWHQIPHCTCPHLDNRERMGTGMNIITEGCPIHS